MTAPSTSRARPLSGWLIAAWALLALAITLAATHGLWVPLIWHHVAMHYHGRPTGMHYHGRHLARVLAMHFHGHVSGLAMHFHAIVTRMHLHG